MKSWHRMRSKHHIPKAPTNTLHATGRLQVEKRRLTRFCGYASAFLGIVRRISGSGFKWREGISFVMRRDAKQGGRRAAIAIVESAIEGFHPFPPINSSTVSSTVTSYRVPWPLTSKPRAPRLARTLPSFPLSRTPVSLTYCILDPRLSAIHPSESTHPPLSTEGCDRHVGSAKLVLTARQQCWVSPRLFPKSSWLADKQWLGLRTVWIWTKRTEYNQIRTGVRGDTNLPAIWSTRTEGVLGSSPYKKMGSGVVLGSFSTAQLRLCLT